MLPEKPARIFRIKPIDAKQRTVAVLDLFLNGNSSGARFDRKSTILLVGYPLVLFLFFILPSSSAARNLLVVVAFTHFWYNRYQLVQIKMLATQITVLTGLLLISYITFSLFWSTPPFNHNAENQLRYGFVTLLFWVVSILYFNNNTLALKHIYWVFGMGVLGNLLGAWLTEYSLDRDGRLTGYSILNNPIILGSVAVIQVAIGVHLRYRAGVDKAIGVALLVIAMILIILTGSRGPLLALLAVFFVWFWSRVEIKPIYKVMLIIAVGGTVLLAAQMTGILAGLIERGLSLRPIIWHETLLASQQHWVFGWGWANDFNQSPVSQAILEISGNSIIHPHGLLISSLYYGGVIGLFVHVVFFYAVARAAFQARDRGLALGLVAAILLLTATDTNAAVSKRDFMWLIFWIPVTIVITRTLPIVAPRSAS
ncbi:O-antigen ligase family protein [Ketobacter nezhaii]|uniref:O-antigen ligase family protein n=1 Tax=Ketobacter sp. MCCC 1A13808 TaxID=2602738 RepID=UPI0018DE30E5|nr:O-antigen ligase family protein [Ketobacter sp. MCCC 1A13808]